MLKIDVFKKKEKLYDTIFSLVFAENIFLSSKSDWKKLIENIEEIEFEDLYCMFACKMSLL